jgi:small subunit ribosomal protein S9
MAELIIATGRRKNAIARVRLNPAGKGLMMVNGRTLDDYFFTFEQKTAALKPLAVAGMKETADVSADAIGGGLTGQAGAISLGIARCILKMNETNRPMLRKSGLLTRDPRAKERKKYGRKGARRRFQWTKR